MLSQSVWNLPLLSALVGELSTEISDFYEMLQSVAKEYADVDFKFAKSTTSIMLMLLP